ncbi:MAG TPA: BrnT family toxin [Longimicrobium sp.]|jgi:hypothetical protein
MQVTYHLQGVTFEWDAWKARSNADKHGVTFREAAEAFFDPFCQWGDASVDGESREYVIGYSLAQKLLLVVHTDRFSATRIVSARPATREERRLYEHTR